jgi:hypothetical protein
MYKLATSPLTLSEIFKHSWKLYKSSLGPVFIWSLIIAIIHVLPFTFQVVNFYQRDITGHLVFSWLGLFLFLVFLFIQIFFLIILFYSIYSIAKEQKVDFPTLLKVTRRETINLYLAMVIYFIILYISIVLLILPAIFFAILFSMLLPLIVIEHHSVYNSFIRSAQMVWKHWWQTFFALVIPYSITYLVRSLVKFTPWLGKWMFLVDVILLLFLMPYFYSVLLVQFNNLKIIKALSLLAGSDVRRGMSTEK